MKAIAEFFINHRVVTLVITFLMIGLGIQSYQGMSRLEDPEFTIKDALVITPYPGASAQEVEEEVTDEMEIVVQKMGQLDQIVSRSERDLSTLTVTVQDKYGADTLPQVWDELRRKVTDAQGTLPPGAGPSIVVDDYGDVYGVFFVLFGKEYSYAELKSVADNLRKELLLVQDVAKIDTLGENPEAIYVELIRDRMGQTGIPVEVVINELQQKNLVQNSGRIQIGSEFPVIDPTGEVETVEDFGNIRIGVGGKQILLSELAKIRRGYREPQTDLIRFNGESGIAMGISTVQGGNVVTMGTALDARMKELRGSIPYGIEFGLVSVQSDAVTTAVSNFIVSLIEAVVIVVIVLLFFMGMRSGLLIGFILLVTILGSFIFLKNMEVALDRISLGALIIALGMLVDNAIVVVDGMLIRIQKGEDSKEAAINVVSKTALPLLGATVIAIMAFAAIGTSQDSTGEFCRSLYQVILVSLSLSWVTAVTITPLLGILILKPASKEKSKEPAKDPYDTKFYRGYRGLLKSCIRFRWITVASVAVVFFVSVWGFGFVKNAFFPPSTRPQFMVDMRMPLGTHIDTTKQESIKLEEKLMEMEGVTNVTNIVGKGALRFLLTYAPERPSSSFAHFLVDVENAKDIDGIIETIDNEFPMQFPDANLYGYKFELGPGSKGKIEARFFGEDANVLRSLANQTLSILNAEADAKSIRTDWRERVKVIKPQILEQQAIELGLNKASIAKTLRMAFQGLTVGVFREGDLLLPIILKAPPEESSDIASLKNIQIWSSVAGQMIPISQVVSHTEVEFEDEIIYRRDRKRSISIYADPAQGTASQLLETIGPKIEALDIPDGYYLEWGGEFESSSEANASLAASIPIFMGIMVILTIFLFNSLRQALVIWLCVPLTLIGVAAGLLLFDQPFNFMAILGFLSLVGMLIKNAIVLVDEINEQNSSGKSPLSAILDSGVGRLRPVAMAAATTALGMIPLFFDAFFVAMAITIIFGLMVATVLTMLVLPVFYAIIFRVPNN